ncbi:MAG: DUF4919 domain-containing protein [Muribaculaceae bacterium]|nr:DUF4919 domain-containing protein [Muribaculaceae bacterium]MDE6352139.1 DUF4919 domain-containing protein [Muribaculaceae bacterium]MDE6642524.1 DUF4919 domain-containing protein [Muribaculaceae bacterium]
MKKLLLLVIAITTAYIALDAATPVNQAAKNAARRPDMAKIKQEVNNPESQYYYPKLIKMYEQNETIMNLEQYRHLYLGTMFQEDYNPYRHSPLSAGIEALYYKEKHTNAELDSIISSAERLLEDDPFDLSQINYLIFALRHRGKNNRADIWQYRLNHLLQAIISTGTGLDTENAWYVINPRHEYNIINFKNQVAQDQNYVEPYFDHITLKKTNDKTPAGYYFNIRYILEEYYRKFPE